MPNFTIEDYKNAIKKKYEIEKRGEYSNHFNSLSNINLKNLCIKRYNSISGKNEEDLEIFFSFFGFRFDPTRRNLFNDYLDKFKNVRSFLTGKTISPKDETIHFSAVLVDFHPRPLNKFLLEWNGEEYQGDNSEKEKEEKDEGEADAEEEQTDPPKVSEPVDEKGSQNTEDIKTQPVGDVKDGSNKFNKRLQRTIAGVGIMLFLSIVISYYAFPNKQCMQWSGDHYDIVDCDLKIQSFTPSSKIELLDESLVNLRKVVVCDTTTCFDKNGVAIIWYAKTANGIDFFNIHGRHPENNSPLRPVTHYILNKYVKK